MPDLSVEAVSRLSPAELVLLIDQLEPADAGLADVDIDELAKLIDPSMLTGAEFVRLISSLQRLSGAKVDLSRMGPQTFARLIANAAKEQVEEVLARPELRELILTEIFRRMQAHLRQDRARGVEAVVHWRFSEGTGEGGYDHYETVISNGTCTINRETTGPSRVTITMPANDFVRLITSNASAPVLFMTGRLKLRGDLGFAAGMLGLFDLPKP